MAVSAPVEPACPVITSITEAIALGQALARVMCYDAGWAERVYQGDPAIHYNTGPAVLNAELHSLWHDGYFTHDERCRITAEYVAQRLSR